VGEIDISVRFISTSFEGMIMKNIFCIILMVMLLVPASVYSHGFDDKTMDGMVLTGYINEAIEKTIKEQNIGRSEKDYARFCDMLEVTIKMLKSVSEECKGETTKEKK
jgi:hypothetical protein